MPGGCRIVDRPGRTPGPIPLYLPERPVLIAGGLLRYGDGQVCVPPGYTKEDPAQAAGSLAFLAGPAFESLYGCQRAYLPADADRPAGSPRPACRCPPCREGRRRCFFPRRSQGKDECFCPSG